MGLNAKSSSRKQTSIEDKVTEFPIVGVGASAGGLDAFKVLLEFLPVDTGLAFVIIQHLAAGQESMLTDILSRFTKMPVLQVKDGMHVEPNHVYVIPPGSTMTLVENCLKLNPKGKSLRPVDAFLSSLATERKAQAIGVVLSGTGTDGTEGLKAVRAEAGITFAQDPESAQYAGMPQSAISAEAVDFILYPEKIAKEISRIAKHPPLVRAEIVPQEPKATKETGLRKIFTLLKLSFNVDFTHYKETVIHRRINRRMVINHVDNITRYAEYLGAHPAELQALFSDMLIGVTSFFREPDTFSFLKEKLFPELLKNLAPKEPIRIWIPGCSTGEEAYSFAIALQEFLEGTRKGETQVQIFGTDVNEKNVDKARQGIYPKSIEADVSESRLKHFFTRFNGSYQIAKFIRDKLVFARQDLTADPPFSNLSLISCRNMLIYFDSQYQERIISILHYALRPNGFLVLGESESIGKSTTLFETVFKKGCIYVKKNAEPRVNFGFASTVPFSRKTVLKQPVKKDPVSALRDEVDRLLITEYVPAALLVNNDLDILVFRGNVTAYLSPESGQASLNLAKLIRKELRAEVQTAVCRAKKENKPVKVEAVRFQYEDQPRTINISVIPLRAAEYAESFFLVLFDDVSSAAAHLRQTIELTATPEGRENVKNSQIRDLKEELESAKQYLQTVIENQESTNEELRAAMEEVQSSNEELQSTNEELETAKEELQSGNEELTTLNDEMKNRNQTLARLNDNLANLDRNIDPAVVMVDGSLKIRLFTPSAQKILNLNPSDTGLPISKLRLAISIPDLEKTISKVISTLGAENREVVDEKGCSYEMRVRPYITEDDRIDGAVLSFIDVDVLKKHEEELRVEKEKYRTLTENSPDIIARVDKNLRYLFINSAFEKTTGLPIKNFIGRTNQEVKLPPKFNEAWTQILQSVFQTGKGQKGEFEFPSREGAKYYQYAIVPEFAVNGNVETLLAILKDITERKKTEEALAASEQKYRTIVETAAEGIVIAKPDGTHTFVNDRLAQMFGYTTEELLRKSSFELMAKEEQRRQALQVRKSLEKKQVLYSEFEFCRKDGSILWAACNSSPLFDENGKHVANISMFSDITERKKTEEALKKSEAEYSSLFANMIDGFAHCQMIFDDAGEPVDFVYLQVNDAYEKITGLKRQVVVGKKVTQLIPGIRATNPEIFEIYGKVALTGQKEKFVYFLQPLGLWLSVSAYCPARGYFAAVFEDGTERKKAENEREIMVEFLRIANAATCSHDLIEGALDFFQKQCGCEAVGIRLKEGDDYPYYETKGFPVKHVKLENRLCKSDESGYVIRDSKGRPVLECMCGNVICGRFDSSKKFFTENGSFWTNSTTQLLASTISADRQGTTRNRCNSEGYESVALIALRIGETRLGLLQLNDKRKDMFTLETVQMWERIADRLALALSRNIAEEALREDEVKFRTVADFAYNWEYWIGPDGNMIYVSPSSKRITSYDANEFIKDPELLTKIVYPEDKPIVGPHFDMISSDELHAVDFRIVTRDGKIRWVSHTCKAVFDDNGKWIGRRASNRDITLRKKIEQRLSITLEESQLRQSEISALLKASRAVLHHQEFPDSTRAIFDACKELIGATAGYVALLSDTGKENEVLFLDSGGLPCTVDPSLPMPIRGLRGEVYGTGKVAIENNFPESEWQKFSPKGHVLLENVMFAPLTIERRTVGVIGLANKPGGFTKRDAEMAKAFGEIASVALVNSKMLEMLEENGKQLETYSEHLEALVEERTQKLRDSERLAAIGETAGMVGHDIRNPLQSITGELYLARTSLESLPDNNVKEEIRESIGYIEEQLLYVNKIVLDLQDFAKAAKPQLQEVDLEKTLQNVLSAMNIPENISVSASIRPDFPKINSDPLFLKRILTNLTSNAAQAMPNGGKITITATCHAKKIVVTIADTGQGISDDVKDKLFKPLFTTKAKGQGLGLAIVKKLTEALDGKVTVESELGKGTRFNIELPET